ncbi:anthocyanidin 3-O-glucoside 2''-O-glucosyltransferase [Ipomoea triloba]|uniref:anthocyanidin 3-O-glucoside 2''-O-glucosyltransferase n=1 Tax=Ipomoea triloba TaxID=35885 RepID=UPI00125D40B0|nr:anthocyanidin 3-O-glucoside 2''-O-glucosyltransferase [Ipomoea triloba]
MGSEATTYHMAMYPWFGVGHLTAFFRLANKLANKGHRISFFIPKNTQSKLASFNLHPHLISFVPITVPSIPGLPPGAETTSDVPFSSTHLLMEAMDKTQSDIEIILKNLQVDVVFFDFTHWLPSLARKIGIKSVFYSTISPLMHGFALSPERRVAGKQLTEADMMKAPASFPDPSIKLHAHEARGFTARTVMKFGGDITFFDRIFIAVSESDGLAYSTCREIEGQFCDYIETQFKKPVLLAGPALPVPSKSTMEQKWSDWLGKFKEGSVIYCAFGSECTLRKEQFQELLWGLELTGMPFFAALKPPFETDSIEAAIPEELREKIQGKGIVHGGWVQQQLFLQHPSVGCFVSHCGWASLSEALVNDCQIVLLPQVGDQIINARIMSVSLKVGVEVEKGEEDGVFSRESVCKAVKVVMDEKSEIGRELRGNHDKLRGFLLNADLDSKYMDSFNQKLQDLLG